MPVDLLLDSDFDLLIQDGDLVAGDATRQHQALLLLTEKGENREFPTRGVGLQSWMNDDVSFQDVKREIKREFERDGMKVEQVSASGSGLQVEGRYNE